MCAWNVLYMYYYNSVYYAYSHVHVHIVYTGECDDSAAIYDIVETREDLVSATPPLPHPPHDDPHLNAPEDEGQPIHVHVHVYLLSSHK